MRAMKFYQFQSNIKLFQKVSSVTQQFKTLNLVNEVRDLNLFRKKTHHYLEKNFQVDFRICSKFDREKTVFCCFCKEKQVPKKSTDSIRQTKEQSLLWGILRQRDQGWHHHLSDFFHFWYIVPPYGVVHSQKFFWLNHPQVGVIWG